MKINLKKFTKKKGLVLATKRRRGCGGGGHGHGGHGC